MGTISEFIQMHGTLAEELRRYSFPEMATLAGGLLLNSCFHANTLRIEAFLHLAAVCCNGGDMPRRDDLARLLSDGMRQSPLAPHEDPPEDVFVGYVNSDSGGFRVFRGILDSGDFWVERMLNHLETKQELAPIRETVETVVSLLRLSEASAGRVGLERYVSGGGSRATHIELPGERVLSACSQALRFTQDDLRDINVDATKLNEFIFNDEARNRLADENLWHSSLERRPLLATDNGVLVVVPSAIPRAAIRFMAERMTETGLVGILQTLYDTENAGMLVNDVAKHLSVEILSMKQPRIPDGAPLLYPAFGRFDTDKYAILLSLPGSIVGAANEFDGCDFLTSDAAAAISDYVGQCATMLKAQTGASRGLVLLSMAGVGRAMALAFQQWPQHWRLVAAPLPDWLTLARSGDCSAMRLWKFTEHQAAMAEYGIEIPSPSDFMNLYSFWMQNGFRLIPRDVDINLAKCGMTIGCDHALALREASKRGNDIHTVRAHDGRSWVLLSRESPKPAFGEDEPSAIYVDRDALKNGRLIGCSMSSSVMWWVVAPDVAGGPDLKALLYRFWECLINWVNRAALVAPDVIGDVPPAIELNLILPGFADWAGVRHGEAHPPAESPAITENSETARLDLTIREGFLGMLHRPDNDGERALVRAVLQGTAELAGNNLTDAALDSAVDRVVPNRDARFFHVYQTNDLQEVVGEGRSPSPVFIAEEDLSLSHLGVAELVGPLEKHGDLSGRKASVAFLHGLVTKLWERVEKRLEALDRSSVVAAGLSALHETARDAHQWDLTTRAMQGLHQDVQGIHKAIQRRRSDRARSNLATRAMIETAQFACAESGKPLSRADHLAVMGDFTLLIEIAHHCDAIAGGFMKPEILIHPNGEIAVDEEFYQKTVARYWGKRMSDAIDAAATRYESYFEQPPEPSEADDARLATIDAVFTPEYGFSTEYLFRFSDLLSDFSVKQMTAVIRIKEPDMLALLSGCGMTHAEAESFLSRLTLPIRSAWNSDLPTGCGNEDIYPWCFRRQLSLMSRPLVQVSTGPRAWIVSSPGYQTSVRYLLWSIEEARFPLSAFTSEEMLSYWGSVARQRGHAFTQEASDVFRAAGFEVRTEVEMTELGASAADGLGDVDVLAWSPDSGQVFIVECKRLRTASTVREIVQQLARFAGDKEERDSLGRHLRRIDWLAANPSALAEATGIPEDRIRQVSLLVTSYATPMQYFAGIEFPVEQIVPICDLSASIADL